MTTIGVLGPASWKNHVPTIAECADVLWGVDEASEAVRHATDQPVNVLVVDASVSYLTPEVMRMVPHTVGRIVAIAETPAIREWVEQLLHIESCESLEGLRHLLIPDVSPVETESSDAPQDVFSSGARVIAVWGPVGAPGITTTAISLATVCAQAGLATLLCDVDSRGASAAVALGIHDDAPGFAAACRLAGREELNPAEIARVMSSASTRGFTFSVLTGLPRASRWVEMAAAKATVVLDTAATMFDVVIVDVGFGVEENEWIDDAPQRDGTTRTIIRAADAVVAVGMPDPVGMTRLIRGLDDIRELCPKPIVVLNKVSPNNRGDAVEAIRRFTEHTVFATIPRDSRDGLDDSRVRAMTHPDEWRRIVNHTGVHLGAVKRRGWRR